MTDTDKSRFVATAEEWRAVADFPHYEVSNFGNVRSHGWSQAKWHLLKPGWTGTAYHVKLCRDGHVFMRQVHRLVATAFLDPPAPERIEVNHKDGSRRNNRVENLEWVTPSENCQHACNVLGHGVGERNGFSRLTGQQVLAMRAQYATGTTTHRALAAQFGVARVTVAKILMRQMWTRI